MNVTMGVSSNRAQAECSLVALATTIADNVHVEIG